MKLYDVIMKIVREFCKEYAYEYRFMRGEYGEPVPQRRVLEVVKCIGHDDGMIHKNKMLAGRWERADWSDADKYLETAPSESFSTLVTDDGNIYYSYIQKEGYQTFWLPYEEDDEELEEDDPYWYDPYNGYENEDPDDWLDDEEGWCDDEY